MASDDTSGRDGPRRRHTPFLVAALVTGALLAALFVGRRALGLPPRTEVLIVFGVLAWALTTLVYVLVRIRPGWIAGTLLTLGVYLAAETFAAPKLAGVLALDQYVLVVNPDHRPPGGRPGWNADGLPQTLERDAFEGPGLNVMFLGDSFTQGSMLARPLEDAFPHVVGRDLAERITGVDVRVANFGWSSSSPLLSLRRMRDIGAAYAPDLVVLCLDMTDPHDDIKWRNLLERRGICALYERIPMTVAALNRLAPELFWDLYSASVGGNLPYHRYFATEQPLDDSRPFLEPVTANIDAIAALAGELGAEFQLVVFPRWFQYDERECPNDWEMDEPRARHTVLGPHSLAIFDWALELSAARPYPVHSLLDAFRSSDVFPTCLDDDPHWNPDGHRIAADAILDAIWPAALRLAEAEGGRAKAQ